MLNQQPSVETIPQAEQREPFVIDNQEKAAWAMRKLAKIRQKQAENTSTAKAMTDELNSEIQRTLDWLRGVNQEEEDSASYFVGGLEAYYWKQMEDNPKSKTVKLPHGQLKSKVQQPEYIKDDEALLLWAKEFRLDAVKVKETVDWAAVKKDVKLVNDVPVDSSTGAVIDGVTVTERPPKFEIVTE